MLLPTSVDVRHNTLALTCALTSEKIASFAEPLTPPSKPCSYVLSTLLVAWPVMAYGRLFCPTELDGLPAVLDATDYPASDASSFLGKFNYLNLGSYLSWFGAAGLAAQATGVASSTVLPTPSPSRRLP